MIKNGSIRLQIMDKKFQDNRKKRENQLKQEINQLQLKKD